MQIPVQIDIKGRTIMGMFHVPENCIEGIPVLLMCYGFNGNRVDQHRMSVIAGRKAEQQGICLLRFDYRGHGLSEGEFWEVILNNRLEDVIEASNFIKGCFKGKVYSLIPIGFSDGARITASIIDKLENIFALCMWSPIFSPNSAFFTGKTVPKLIREPNSKKLVYSVYGLWMNSEYLRELNVHSSFEGFRTFAGPKLCVFGSEDHLVKPTIDAIEASGFKGTPNLKTVYVADSRHVYSRSDWADEVINETLKWVIDVISKKKTG